MTDSMVERVARAIFETWAADGNSDATWEELLLMQTKDGYAEGKKIYGLALKEARAAIDAMYEPTDAMIDAGQWQVDPVSLYKSFVTAALNEQVSG